MAGEEGEVKNLVGGGKDITEPVRDIWPPSGRGGGKGKRGESEKERATVNHKKNKKKKKKKIETTGEGKDTRSTGFLPALRDISRRETGKVTGEGGRPRRGKSVGGNQKPKEVIGGNASLK